MLVFNQSLQDERNWKANFCERGVARVQEVVGRA